MLKLIQTIKIWIDVNKNKAVFSGPTFGASIVELVSSNQSWFFMTQ